jgi:hypothetical protein
MVLGTRQACLARSETQNNQSDSSWASPRSFSRPVGSHPKTRRPQHLSEYIDDRQPTINDPRGLLEVSNPLGSLSFMGWIGIDEIGSGDPGWSGTARIHSET